LQHSTTNILERNNDAAPSFPAFDAVHRNSSLMPHLPTIRSRSTDTHALLPVSMSLSALASLLDEAQFVVLIVLNLPLPRLFLYVIPFRRRLPEP
jgi:hypothetical protein